MLEFTHTPDAGAAGAARPRAGAVRSRRAARPDREAPAQGPAPGARRSRPIPACACPAPSTDSRWACARSSGSRSRSRRRTTIACRFVEAFGEPIVTPFPELNRLTPAPARVAAASVDDIARHGIVAARARSIIALAQGAGIGALCLDGGAHHNPDDVHPAAGGAARHRPVDGALHRHARAALARRVPEGRHRGAQQPRRRDRRQEAEALSQAWRPWRSYAVMHVWAMGTPAQQSHSKRSLVA